MSKVIFGDVVTRANTKEDRFNTDKIYYVGGEHIDSNEVLIEKRGLIAGSTIGPMFYFGFKKGDILFVSRNPHLRKAGMVTFDGICSEKTFVLESKDESVLLQRYLAFVMQSDHFWAFMEAHKSGSVNYFINWSTLAKYEFELPDIATQRRLSDILWAINKSKHANLELIEATNGLVKSQFIELFEKEEYKKVAVSSVLNTGFWLMPATPEFIVDGEVPYITSKNIKNRTIDFDNVKYISRAAYKSISANRPTQKGDILISMIGTLGQTALIQDDREFYGQNLYLLRLNNAIVNTTYFCEFFNSDTAQYELQGKRNQSTQAYLKANHVEDLILPLPPMELQEQFAAFVKQTDKSKFELQQTNAYLDELTRSILFENFR